MKNPPQRIVLVGNGRSLLDRPGLGATIDGFDVVVRFNEFRAEGFEACVGARTDWWARNETPMRPRAERFSRIVLRPRMEEADEYRRSADATLAELDAAHRGTPVDLVARETFLDLRDGYGFRNAPFTGTLVVAHLLRRFPTLHVCGFDGLGADPEAGRHYYDAGNVVGDWGAYHDAALDARYLSDRAAEGRLVVL